MNTRMDKYFKKDNLEESRTSKNKEIYNKVSEEDFDKLSLTSNISIIDADTTNLDIEKLKKLLDEKYSSPKQKRTPVEVEPDEEEEVEDTKEYDLNKIIDEAHKNKSTDYDRERFKKLRDTQFDILNSLNLNRDEDPIIEESLTVEEANLMNLIKTVNENALKRDQINKKENELLDDLKGDDSTEVLEPIDLEDDEDSSRTGKKPTIVEELEKTKQLSKKEILDEYKKIEEIKEETVTESEEYSEDFDAEDEIEEPSEVEENTFYTGKYQITENDLDDFEELQKEMKSGGVFIKILIILLVLILLAVALYLLNKYLNLGLF